MPSTRTLPSTRRLPLSDLEAFPDLFLDVAAGREQALKYYAGDWRDERTRRTAADRVVSQPADRNVLADALLDHNTRWSPDGTVSHAVQANIERLRRPDSVAVVTGQQVGLFTGPLYTIYKTITAMQVAGKVARQADRDVVPVFWVEGEDHDFDEIAGAHLLRRNEVETLSIDGRTEASTAFNPGPVGRLVLSDAVGDLLDELDAVLPNSDFKADLVARVRDAYQPGTRVEDAFARLVRSLFPDAGIVLMNPDDRRLKKLAAPLFRRDLTDPHGAVGAVQAASEALEDDGYHAQVHARPTNLFLLDDDGRLPIDLDEEASTGDAPVFRLRGTERTYAQSDLLDLLDAEPERFSPNVVLRPLMQDALLPTAAYVAGPGEVSYFAQYKGVYDWAEMEMPLIVPRASVSLVESKVQSVLDDYDLDVPDFTGDVEKLFQEIVVEEMEVDVDAVFGEAMAQVHGAVNELKPSVEAVDRTLVKSAEATRANLVSAMNELKQRVVRAEKRQHDQLRARLQKARVNLVPDGALQERRINALYFLNKYSPALIDTLRTTLSPDTSAHQVVEL